MEVFRSDIADGQESRDKIECAKSPNFRAILASLGELGETHECLAGDAVHIAPVST
jgi:hypothetical protein